MITRASKLFALSALVLALMLTASAEAKHDHGGGHGGGWHGGGGGKWREAGFIHDHGRHLGWYKHGWGRAGWQGGSPRLSHIWGGPRFVGAGPDWWIWPHAWGWNDFGRGWRTGAWEWGGLLFGASFGVIVAPPLIVAPPPIYVAPPPIIVGLPAIAPPPIATVLPPAPEAAPLPPIGALFGAALPPPIVVLPPPELVVAAALPLVIVTPPAFALFVCPPILASTIGSGWWHSGLFTGGLAASATAAIAYHGRPGYFRERVGFYGRSPMPARWARGGGYGWSGGGFGRWREARMSAGGFGGGRGLGRWHEARMGGGGERHRR